KYSIITQFSDLLRSMAGLIGGVLGPVMMILYSRNEQEKMAEMTKIFMKAMSLTMAIPIVVICVFSKEIIELWVGPAYDNIAYLVWFIVFPLIINLGTIPLFTINIAMNKVKVPSILNVIFGCIGLLTALSLVNFYHMGLEGIALGFVLATTLKNSLFTPLYAAYILNLSKITFLAVHIRVIVFSL
ncbi:lipopolysaccharide biosynthesis protein, partial [Escherichia coli]|uniref:lipopolysaccharide biosynthesis protein n=5 Tax=Enterobacterales TaxID=91347 RepID=UPI003CC90BB6